MDIIRAKGKRRKEIEVKLNERSKEIPRIGRRFREAEKAKVRNVLVEEPGSGTK